MPRSSRSRTDPLPHGGGTPEEPPAGAVAVLLPVVLSHLPEPPGTVLVIPGGARVAEGLRRKGYRVVGAPAQQPELAEGTGAAEAGEEPAGVAGRAGGEEPPAGDSTAGAAGAPPVDAAVLLTALLPAGVELPAVLGASRSRVEPSGRLLVVAPAGAQARATIRFLYEAGFAVLDDLPIPGAAAGTVLVVARPARHRVRPYRPGDEEAILQLFARAFHRRRSVERWRWEYGENPLGNHRISVAVDGEERLLAHYAGYPVHVWTDTGLGGPGPRTLDCLHIGDTMTAPEARRIGRRRTNLLTRTVQHFYATWCRGRVAFNFGANTGKIQRFSRRTAGARRLEPVPFHARALPGPRFPAPGPLGALFGGWRVARADGFDERFDALWRRCRGAYRLLVARDRRYLAWRYAAPETRYFVWTVSRWGRLVGWSVFRQEAVPEAPEARRGGRGEEGQETPAEREGERLIWGDALFDPRHPRAPAVLLSRVVGHPVHRRARRLEGWLTPRPAWWGRIVLELGFRSEPEPEDLGFVYVPFEVDPGDAFAAHLYYTKGDTDLF